MVVNKVCNTSKDFIELPDRLDIIVTDLDDSTHGETIVNLVHKNKIKLNHKLSLKESVFVLAHELLHISQIHRGILGIHKNGNYIWEGKQYMNLARLKQLSYNEYLQLPWEQDVVLKQQKLLKNLLNF